MNIPQPTTTRSKITYFIWSNMPRFVLLAMMVLIVLLFFVIKEESAIIAANKAAAVSQEKPPVNGVTYLVTPSPIADRINLPGIIEPWTELNLMAKISGTITKVLVKEGDSVKKGDVLVHIEDDDYAIALERAQAAYNLAKAEYKRDKSIYDKGVIPTATLDTNRTAMQTAKADYENAKLMLSRTKVKAPMSGIIKKLDGKVGLLLSVGDPIAEIFEINRMKGVIGIPESDVLAAKKLETVDITVQALGDRTIRAKKYFLSPAPETVARIYNLELEVDNSENELLAGMFIRADIIKQRFEDSLNIPFYSVISRNDEQYVYIEEDGLAKKRSVELGIMEQWMVQVTAGLSPGDKLLIEGHRDVEDSQKINVIKEVTDLKEIL